MNPHIAALQPYPFERLAALKAGVTPPPGLGHIALSIGEPQHRTPGFIGEKLLEHLHMLGRYPATKGLPELREAICHWLARRFGVGHDKLDPDRHVLPLGGTREGLFAAAQALVDASRPAVVISPNPFYQIYEGAALLAGATPYYVNCRREDGYRPDYSRVPEAVWQATQLVYICSPGNPTGAVMSTADFAALIELADRYDFVIASDECYSELYFDEDAPPQGILGACAELGRDDFHRCLAFHSLSKRSNAPGLRSGFVAGDAELLASFFKYRTYHGCAMPMHVQLASAAAWSDENHVRENRTLYREKFGHVLAILHPVLDVAQPDAGFYLWPTLPMDDTEFARRLFATENVTVLPGSYLSRDTENGNPGSGHARIALVAETAECIEAAHRIRRFIENHC